MSLKNSHKSKIFEHKARKRFGQNFLIDEHVISSLIHSIGLKKSDYLVEIGPGLGALTKPLLKMMTKMTAIELDRDLIENLSQWAGLTIIHQDVLTVDIASLVRDQQKIRFVGNLPYNISTPIIFHLMSFANVIEDMHFMLQKEVVERISAVPNSKSYGRLSVMVQRFCHVDPLMLIPPEAFSPAPKVTSQFMRLTPHQTAPVTIDNEAIFADLVKASFAMKRKTLRNNLKDWLNFEDIIACDIDPSIRAEGLSLAEFARLANFVSRQRS